MQRQGLQANLVTYRRCQCRQHCLRAWGKAKQPREPMELLAETPQNDLAPGSSIQRHRRCRVGARQPHGALALHAEAQQEGLAPEPSLQRSRQCRGQALQQYSAYGPGWLAGKAVQLCASEATARQPKSLVPVREPVGQSALQLGERLPGWDAPAEMFTPAAVISAYRKRRMTESFLQKKDSSYVWAWPSRPGVLVVCRVRCTRAHGADGCSGDHTAGDADMVCEPVAWSQVLA